MRILRNLKIQDRNYFSYEKREDSLIHNNTIKTKTYRLYLRRGVGENKATSRLHLNAIKSHSPLVLGIESSCDDTGVAIVDSSGKILSEALATQVDIHAQWGGVVPKLASEAHQKAIDNLVAKVIQEANVTPSDLSAIAVTIGPGLSLCLRVGILKARELSYCHGLPLVGIHHMEAHALIARMGFTDINISYPFFCLLVSGGHNLLLVVHGVSRYTEVGTTLDDSLGEAYDKIARLLELDLRPSGGAALEKLAENGDPNRFGFKVPMQKYLNCDFSYAGLKNSVRMTIEKEVTETSCNIAQVKADIAASFQKVAVAHLEDKCQRGIQWALGNYPQIRHFVVSGGVAANQYVRSRIVQIAKENALMPCFPPPRLCTDNGVMVAWAGIERYQMGLWEKPAVSAVPLTGEWVDIRPRWPLTKDKAFQNQNPNLPKKKRMHQSLTCITEEQLKSKCLNI